MTRQRERLGGGVLALCIAVCFAAPGAVSAQDKPKAEANESATKEAVGAGASQTTAGAKPADAKPAKTEGLFYSPPEGRPGAPSAGARVGGATRAGGPGLPALVALVPEHVGLTASSQPVLFFYLSGPTDTRVDFTLSDPDAVSPVVEVTLPGPLDAGIHAVRLADHDVELRPDATYSWFVGLVPDSASRASDVIAGGLVELRRAPEALAVEVSGSRDGGARAYAEGGYWYDALGAVFEESDEAGAGAGAPGAGAGVHQKRAALLGQVGLDEVATYELQQD